MINVKNRTNYDFQNKLKQFILHIFMLFRKSLKIPERGQNFQHSDKNPKSKSTVCQSCRSLRNVSFGGRISGLIKCAYHGWLSMMTPSEGSFLFFPGDPNLKPTTGQGNTLVSYGPTKVATNMHYNQNSFLEAAIFLTKQRIRLLQALLSALSCSKTQNQCLRYLKIYQKRAHASAS